MNFTELCLIVSSLQIAPANYIVVDREHGSNFEKDF